MFQVVIGMQVGEVYEEVEKLITPKTDSGASTQGKEKKSAFDIAADLSPVFLPDCPCSCWGGHGQSPAGLIDGLPLDR
ncbi:hypothetical protein [Allobaculum sp. JKK-2023]|uniref:hypothetical protein n=1 Tax=Allobaculum sp. JKK-2023 TaxID=3108943 RepID=UPI002B0566DE|nr:hypothetical protein [Allobaculum sp. JKK-2023]